jgi:hypothetical protein
MKMMMMMMTTTTTTTTTTTIEWVTLRDIDDWLCTLALSLLPLVRGKALHGLRVQLAQSLNVKKCVLLGPEPKPQDVC